MGGAGLLRRYLIAGLRVEMDLEHSLLIERSEKYLHDFIGKPDISIPCSKTFFEKMREEYPSATDSECEYAYTCGAFYRQLIMFDGFMLHSSCLSYNGKAYLFSATSGTGKSTHTSLWKQYVDNVTIINDDKPAVRLIGDTFFASGTPWSGKSDLSQNTLLPVGAVALLSRGDKNTIHKSPAAVSVIKLLKQTAFSPKREGAEHLATLLDNFIRNVPIWSFECNISEQAVVTSFEAMTGEKYIKRK